jgi:hypothetical protein
MDVQPHSVLAHEHGTTRRARSPALPENKALLLTAPSDLGSLLPSVAHLSDLHLVQAIPVWYLITTPPPPSVLHAGILASRSRVKQFQSSPVPRGRVLATLSLPALRRVSRGRTLTEVETVRHTHRHRLVKCISRFHLSGLTTLPSQVPFVSIGRRGSPCLCFGSKTLVHCQRASHLEQCRCSTHAACPSHRSPDGPFQATRSPVKGRTPPYPMGIPASICLQQASGVP